MFNYSILSNINYNMHIVNKLFHKYTIFIKGSAL